MGSNEIYYLPGMGGRIDAGLGRELLRRGYALSGRETIGEFKKLRFGEQVDAVKKDFIELFWRPEARVIANSFGGYLFLHAQIGLEPFPGRVLLLSPIIGSMDQSANGVRFYPPRADVLRQIAKLVDFLSLVTLRCMLERRTGKQVRELLLNFVKLLGSNCI